MPAHPQRSRGFTLIEALVALVIVALGLIALVGVQLRLSRDAEGSRQRTEATRLAQEKLEELRTFTQIKAGAGASAWDALAAGNEAVAGLTSNTAFTRTWSLGGAVGDAQRPLRVSVAWDVRANDRTETLTLNSVISRTDPEDVGGLAFPQSGDRSLKRPKNRSLNIPVPATDLGNRQSAYQFGGMVLVFNNVTGSIVKTCPTMVTTAAELEIAGCTDFIGYLLAGYISGDLPASLGVNTANLSGLSTAAQCRIDAARDQSTGSIMTGYRYYICALPVSRLGDKWSGTVRLSGLNTVDRRVCRYQYPAQVGVSDNERNVQPYAGVFDSLDAQNYKIMPSNRACPTETVSGNGNTSVSLQLTLHQDCTNSNNQRAAHCPAL
jgi:prepilin-type N-terminal cleavage/methylation domain-containing protein